MSITMHIEVRLHDSDGNVGVGVHTDPFDPKEQTDDMGAMWVGICQAINAYVRSRGIPNFDCLKAHRYDN